MEDKFVATDKAIADRMADDLIETMHAESAIWHRIAVALEQLNDLILLALAIFLIMWYLGPRLKK